MILKIEVSTLEKKKVRGDGMTEKKDNDNEEKKTQKSVDIIAKSKWIDDLSKEEMKVLKKSHQLDVMMRKGKSIKVGLLEDLK